MTSVPLDASTTIVAASDLLVTEFDDELVILDLKNGVYYGLSEVGARLWQLVQQPTTRTELCAVIESEYHVAADICQRDVAVFLSDLANRGLVDICKRA